LAGYPADNIYEKERHISSGKIMSINGYEFEHTLDTRQGSSGAPICLFENVQVIGIHKGGDKIKPINYATFIGLIIDELEKEYKQMQKSVYNKNIKKINDPIYDIINEKIWEYLSDYLAKIKAICIQNISKVLPPTFAKSSKHLVLFLTQNEDGYSVYKSKILNLINKIASQPDLLKINFLNVMVVGKTGVGKSTLINSILKLEEEARAKEGDTCTLEMAYYRNKKIPFLQLIDTRGFKFDNFFDLQFERIFHYISEQTKANDIDKIVHCVWFCHHSNRFETPYMRFIKNLSIPVIIVETMALDIYLSKQKKKFFQDLKIGNDFVSVFAKKVKTATTPVVFIHPFGFVELLEKTITQCRLTLKAFYEV
jgi:GTP-binding protein EngB required for normal cell division